MKGLLSVTLIVALVSLSVAFAPVPARQPQGQRVGNITGVVVDREQENGDHSVEAEFNSDVPFNKVEWLLSSDLWGKIKYAYGPDGWQGYTDEKTGALTVTSGAESPPQFKINIRYDAPKASAELLKNFLKRGMEVNFGLGSINYYPRRFEVNQGFTEKIVTPDKAAQFPRNIRPRDIIAFKPLENFRNGVWELFIGDESYKAYSAGSPALELEKILEHLPDQKKAGDEMDRQLDTQFGLNLSGPLIRDKIFFLLNNELVSAQLGAGAKLKLTYTNEYGRTIVSGEPNIKLLPGLTYSSNRMPPPRLFKCTEKIFQGDELCVCGFFPTFFSRGQLLLDGKRLNLPLSSSTDVAVFKPENLPPGKHVVTWDLAGFDSLFNPLRSGPKPSATERVEFLVLALEARIDRNKLFTGQGTTMRMRIIGTEEKLPIKLLNKTASIIDLEGGVEQVAITTGGGENTLDRNVKGIHRGNFDIEYSLALPPCPCNPEQTPNAAQLSGDVRNLPENFPTDQTSAARVDCEQILFEYNKLSIEYGKFRADIRRGLESCERWDDGTITGRNLRNICTAIFTVIDLNDAVNGQRKQLLDLLSRYRSCIEGNPSGAIGY